MTEFAITTTSRCGIIDKVYAYTHNRGTMGIQTGDTLMDREQAKHLGSVLRTRREELNLSTTQVALASDLNQATIVRLEQGQFLSPDPDKLRAVAEALDLNLADVLTLADYPIPTELPSVGPYLRTKYRDLPSEAVDQLQTQIARVLKKHGIEPNEGPRAGEDEQPEDARHSSKQPTKKGGTPL
jgi:transcriptional regulator with XRE-family HTH domain